MGFWKKHVWNFYNKLGEIFDCNTLMENVIIKNSK